MWWFETAVRRVLTPACRLARLLNHRRPATPGADRPRRHASPVAASFPAPTCPRPRCRGLDAPGQAPVSTAQQPRPPPLAGCPHDLDRHTRHRRPRARGARARAHRARSAAAPAAGVGAGAGPRRAARDGGGAAVRRTAGVPHPGHRDRAGRAADQDGLRRALPRVPTACTTCWWTATWSAQAIADGGKVRTIDMATRVRGHTPGPVATLRFDGLSAGRQGRRDLAAAQRDHRAGRPAHRRPGRARARPRSTGLAPPRQLDQPRLQRREPDDHVAGAGGVARRRRAGQPGVRRQCPARPVHRTGDARHPGRPGEREDRHQPRQPRPDAPAGVRAGGPRLPRHDPRGPPHRAAAGRLVDPLPDPRGDTRPCHAGPQPASPRDG